MDCSLDHIECEVTRYLWITLSPVILVIGTTGNALLMLVMTVSSMRISAFGCYLTTIAAMDTIALWANLSRQFVKSFYFYDIRQWNEPSCWMQQLLAFGSMDTSVWLLTAVTAERTVAIYIPHIYKRFASRGKTLTIILLICLLMSGLNAQVFFTRGDEVSSGNTTSINHCGYTSEGARHYWKNIHFYVALSIYSLIPFVSIFIMNVAILCKLKRRDRAFQSCTTVKEAIRRSSCGVAQIHSRPLEPMDRPLSAPSVLSAAKLVSPPIHGKNQTSPEKILISTNGCLPESSSALLKIAQQATVSSKQSNETKQPMGLKGYLMALPKFPKPPLASKQQSIRNASRVSQKTVMLLPVSIFFLVATLPSLIFIIIDNQMSEQTESTRARMKLIYMVVNSVQCLNHSLNFFLYCLSGSNFRKQCRKVLFCCKRQRIKQHTISSFIS